MSEFIIICLAAWRLAHLLVEEDGPGRIFARLRALAGINKIQTVTRDGFEVGYVASNLLAEGLLCIWCVSVWTATLLVLLIEIPFIGIAFALLTKILAVSAGAIIIHEIQRRVRI